jgi:hypothetical protein
MIDEVTRLTKRLGAIRAVERPLARVLPAMRDQVPRDGEGRAAVFAHERALARVHAHVLGEVALRAARGGAARMSACEWPQIRVDALVCAQVAHLTALVCALVARKGFFAGMNLDAFKNGVDK